MNQNKVKIKLREKSAMDQLVDYFHNYIERRHIAGFAKSFINLRNVNGIKFDTVELNQCQESLEGWYECIIIKHKHTGQISEWELENRRHIDFDDVEPLIVCHRRSRNLKEVIRMTLEEMNVWKQCKECTMYVRDVNYLGR